MARSVKPDQENEEQPTAKAVKSSLSAGELIRHVLAESEGVAGRVKKIYPVVTDKAVLPYILYRRSGLEHTPQKAGMPGADMVQIEVICFAEEYAESIEIAEAVRAALDHKQAEVGGMRMRACYLADSEEAWQDDAFVQQLVFNVRI